MGRKLKVVSVSGSLRSPSRTGVLVEYLLAALGASSTQPLEIVRISLHEIAPHLPNELLARDQLAPQVQRALSAIESADLLLAASPVYRASYSGLFKHLFDFVRIDALVDVPVLLAATGGSERHALVIDHQLRPLFSFFQAHTLPVGVYAVEGDFVDERIESSALRERVALAVSRALPALRRRTPEFVSEVAAA